ncbi:MAG TPA: methionine ABC transporter ATP-binding protein [Faecalibacter sp.]
MIELKNINKKFTTSTQTITALDDVSLTIDEGKIFGVIGQSGAGKSTLIRCINLLETPDSGEVWVNGVDLTSLAQAKLTLERRKIGMIFQHFNLLSSRTIFQNVAFPLELTGATKSEIQSKVNELLELVGILDKANEYPANLSGGQKQRVAIARALASNPSVLLCDEATSALDPSTTKSILNLLKEINQRLNITIVLITHEMEVINAICDEVAVMKNGKVVEHGSVETIFTNPKEQITHDFIKKSLDIELPSVFKSKLENDATADSAVIYKISFSNQPNYNSTIAEIKNQFQFTPEVITSRIEYAGSINYGTMFIKIDQINNQEATIENYFKNNQFNIEKIGYVRINH